ncbi:SMR family transporter [Gracilibacillus sp. JCM 18860]|uniref:SMR family transporter n=1 Tax=Gracilibacillus sp. JCM 18860 TaxID=1306159 RepID=UPI0006D07D85
MIIAGLFEVIGVIGVKKVSEKNNFWNNVRLIGSFIISFQYLSMALQEIQLSTAYAIWTGIGTLGSAIIGIIFIHEPKNFLRICCIIGMILTVISLKVVS